MLHTILDVVLHLDTHLSDWSATLGPWLYVVLFLIIFCETGLVVMPFLPGDSLLFAVGAICALPGSTMNIAVMIPALIVAAILGDAVNYKLGHILGRRAFAGQYRFINPKHLERTRDFYERYGGRAIVFARFAPILRTFAPFVAGFAEMPYRRFFIFNVVGGVVWVTSFLLAGFWFGQIPTIKSNFHMVIVGIIVVSLLPAAVEVLRAGRAKNPAA
ncbi:MAG: DedA family protein [Polyangiaceae bacterium]|nr:DedA family protein [Polyangiaceae bacterium]